MSSFAAMSAPALFGFALFLSSALLFWVQPMVGRTLLPHLGGSPVAWSACLVYFQTTLLAGYVYAGLLHRFRGLRWQPVLHLLLMSVAIILCFAGVFGDRMLLELAPRLTDLENWPIVSTLCLLVVVIGVPFFALAAVTPLVQRWFAQTEHPKASDPYYLFVASNLGGLMALVIYPLMIEPFAPLAAQWLSWKLAVTALGVLLLMTALAAWRSPRNPEFEPAPPPSDPEAPVVPRLIGRGPATVGRRFYWLFASALPVGLLMGVTDFLTLEVAPTPILWMLPLALYLLAFSQAFARFSPIVEGNLATRLSLQILLGVTLTFVVGLLVIVLTNVNQARQQDEVAIMFVWCWFFIMLMLTPFSWIWFLQPLSVIALVFVQGNLTRSPGLHPGLMLVYLGSFYLTVRLCVGMLANDRPAAPALTTYYAWIGLGGLVGGLFQLVVAPLIFRRAYLEYSLLAALACTLRAAWVPHGFSDWLLCLALFARKKDDAPSPWPGRIARGFDVGIAVLAAVYIGCVLLLRYQLQFVNSIFADIPLMLALAAALTLIVRPLRSGLALTAVVALCWIGQDSQRSDTKTIVQQRTSFGLLRVDERVQEIRPINDPAGAPQPRRFTERSVMHSTTNHGMCIVDPPELLRYPTTYYHRKGPVGLVMHNMQWVKPQRERFPPWQAADWFIKDRDNARDDFRMAASLVGMMAMPTGASMTPLDPVVTNQPYAMVGLGTGTLFTYARPYQWVDAYELDPAVIALSTQTPAGEKTPVFHYYQSARQRGVQASIIPGDARRSLRKSGREGFYHVIFVDAFNSDAVPSHLCTVEAMELYFDKLAPDGVVCFHASNRHVDLGSVLFQTARRLNLQSINLRINTQNRDDPALFASEWVVIGRNAAALERWTKDEAFAWHEIVRAPPNNRDGQVRFSPRLAWTDQKTSVLTAVRPSAGWSLLIYGMLVVILIFGIVLGLIEIGVAMMPRSMARPVRK